MEVQTSAIVLSSLKYGDTGLIIRCYTERFGAKSFILKNAFSGKNKKASLFTTLNRIKIIYEDKNGNHLAYLKQFEAEAYYGSLYFQPLKMAVVFFLGETLNAVLKEEEPNPSLFGFISEKLNVFDALKSNYADFHLWFLMNFTRFLGFYPHFSDDLPYFDLVNGTSTNNLNSGFEIGGTDLNLFKRLVSLDFPPMENRSFNQTQRRRALDIMIQYYELHIADFRRPKSLDVLHQLFE